MEQPLREVAAKAAELEKAARPEERLKRPDHVRVHHVEVERVSVSVIAIVDRLGVLVTLSAHRCVPLQIQDHAGGIATFAILDETVFDIKPDRGRVERPDF